jgi:predicted transcriptional regulator
MKIRTLKLPPDLDRKVDGYAERHQLSRSEVVREALASYLDEPAGKSGSFAEQAADLAGSLTGPADLSTNPSHLDGYGRSRR